jgi:NADPH:quinone reductase
VPGGGYAEYCVASSGCVLPVPAGVDLVDAAGLPEVHFTVWTNLDGFGAAAPGESVLIHGGSSGIGTAAIQLLRDARPHGVRDGRAARQMRGLRKTRRRARHQLSRGRFRRRHASRRPTTRVSTSSSTWWAATISSAISGRLARQGRLVNIAFQGGMTAQVNFGLMLMKRLSFMATTLRGRIHRGKTAIRDALDREVWP